VKTFFSQFVLRLASINSSSQSIGGTDAWGVPRPKIGGGASPQSLQGLRPCNRELACANILLFHWINIDK